MLAHFQSLRVMHRYFDGEYPEAWTHLATVVDGLLVYVPGMMTVVEHAFFQCLSATALWPRAPAIERAALEARFEAQLRNIETWAANCPQNFASMHLTVAAERARVLGETGRRRRTLRAGHGRGARQPLPARRGHRQRARHEALAAPAIRRARPRWRERAIAAYEAWGAMRKANELRAAAASSARGS